MQRGSSSRAVLVDPHRPKGRQLLCWARNFVNTSHNGTQHGEVILLTNYRHVSRNSKAHGLRVCTTLEPSPMYAGMLLIPQTDGFRTEHPATARKARSDIPCSGRAQPHRLAGYLAGSRPLSPRRRAARPLPNSILREPGRARRSSGVPGPGPAFSYSYPIRRRMFRVTDRRYLHLAAPFCELY